MKILQINKLYYPVIGGIETVVKNIAEGLNNNNNISIDILACENKGVRKEELINGIKVYKSASIGKALGMPLSIDFFKLFFKIKNDYDLFIIHYPFPLASILTPFIPKEKLIIYYHCDIIRQKIFRIPFLPFINFSLKRAKKIIVSGKNIINSSSLLKKYADKCEVIPFGINVDFIDEDYVEAKKIKSKYLPSKIILSIGRLVYYKGFEYAIKSMVSVEAKLLIIGEGPELEKLNNLIIDLKIEDKVYIISPQPRLAPFLLASDIFLFPSTERSEAFGLVQIEAMAAGLPIINTYLNTAVEEVSLNEITGLTIKPKNTNAISEAINKLLNNEPIIIKYGENSKKRYQEFFTKEIFLNKLKKAIL
jgi:rhamnosyl/mannosyltransferase